MLLIGSRLRGALIGNLCVFKHEAAHAGHPNGVRTTPKSTEELHRRDTGSGARGTWRRREAAKSHKGVSGRPPPQRPRSSIDPGTTWGNCACKGEENGEEARAHFAVGPGCAMPGAITSSASGGSFRAAKQSLGPRLGYARNWRLRVVAAWRLVMNVLAGCTPSSSPGLRSRAMTTRNESAGVFAGPIGRGSEKSVPTL